MLSNFFFLIGNEGGVCYLVETFLGRNLSRAFCLIHFIELPFKILMKHYLGDTTGPSARDGMLGEDISELPSNAREMVDFETISGNLEEVDKELIDNYDQYYAYHLAMGIQKGAEYLRQIFKGTPPLPSKMYHARFLLTALHIMRLYIQSNDPSDDLKRAVTICVKWYIPLFFWIKKNCHINQAAKNFFQAIVWARETFNEEEWVLVEACFCRNSYMAHPESILISGVCDESVEVRKKCVEIIIEARQRSSGEVRQYFAPNKLLVFNAKTYLDMVDLRLKSIVTPPPLLENYSDNTLRRVALQGPIYIPAIPCHSVNNERAVKNTSQASKVAVGHDNTHNHILNLTENREQIRTRHTKNDFVPKNTK